jgi:hypothetical protein
MSGNRARTSSRNFSGSSYRRQQEFKSFRREKLRLHGDQHPVGGVQRVDGDEIERGHTVQQHKIVAVLDVGDKLFQDVFAADGVDEDIFGFRKLYARRNKINPLTADEL